MTSLFWTAFALGAAFCAPPGAVLAEALRRGMRRGFGGALLTEFGSLVGDATWAALALSGVAYLTAYRPAATALGALGVALLFWLAWRALRDARMGADLGAASVPTADLPRGTSRGDFAAGAALSLSNPQNITFWAGVGGYSYMVAGASLARAAGPGSAGGAVAALGATHRHVLLVFFAGFMLACVVWCFLMAGMIAWGRRFLSAGFYRWINVVCGLTMAYFGVRLLAALASRAAPPPVP
jgi:chemosensory pili system protein ChpE